MLSTLRLPSGIRACLFDLDGVLTDSADLQEGAWKRRGMRERGVNPYPGSVLFVRAARRAGLRTAVVSASANARDVLEAARISALFDVVVDGSVAKRERLRGKPAPDSYLAAARELGIEREHAAVFEDALAGVESGRAGGFGYVVGVDRDHQMTALFDHGADVVVRDLAELVASQ